MKRVAVLIIACCLGLAGLSGQAAEHAPAEINVGYFQQWPTPSQFSQAKQTYDSVLGIPVNWRAFDNGNSMNAALAAGQIQIAFAHGHVPFIVGVTRGIDMTMVGIALGYPENDLCIVGNSTGIDRASASRLEGQRVATVIGGVTHYKMLKVLEHLKVDVARVEIVPAASAAEAASMLRRGEVAMACAYGNALGAMSDLGQPLMSGAEQSAIGLKLFDSVSVATEFMRQHPAVVQAFMDVTEASNAQWRKNPEPMRAAIARAADMDQPSSNAALAKFVFPTAAEQKSEAWLGARIGVYSKSIAEFFVAQGRLEKSLDSYEPFVSTRFLR